MIMSLKGLNRCFRQRQGPVLPEERFSLSRSITIISSRQARAGVTLIAGGKADLPSAGEARVTEAVASVTVDERCDLCRRGLHKDCTEPKRYLLVAGAFRFDEGTQRTVVECCCGEILA